MNDYKLSRLLNRAGRSAKNYTNHVGIRDAWFLSKFGDVDMRWIKKINGHLTLAENPECRLKEAENHFIIAATPLLTLVATKFPDLQLDQVTAGSLQLIFDGLRLECKTQEEIFFITEVFCEEVYGFRGYDKLRVLDIGANVGFASLYFAKQANVVRVESYELVPKTAHRAQQNFNLNSEISKKISLHSKGVSDRDYETTLTYSETSKGHASLHTRQATSATKPSTSEAIVEILDIATVVKENSKRGESIVIKLDCEGSEYAILERLDAKGILDKIDAFLIEWHVKGARPIENILNANGFATISNSSVQLTHGVTYATRIN